MDPSERSAPLSGTYVLPLATGPEEDLGELADYLTAMANVMDQVIVVDGSDPEAVTEHRGVIDDRVEVVPPEVRTPMGKVGGVMTGVRRARHDRVVVADDDVRYTPEQLAMVLDRLDRAAVVRPQNYFHPLPWHARVDTGRILLNRVWGGDWPGTLGVRRSVLLGAGGYSGDVLFENFELVRTVRAAGGEELVALDLLVRRSPPSTGHFVSQRVRQAYDEWARPVRLVAFLAVGPAVGIALARRRWATLATGAAAVALVAETGRRRAGGARVFPVTASLLAPLWVLERAACSWLAVGARLRGGVRYRGGRLVLAATPTSELRRRLAAQPPSPETGSGSRHTDT